VARKRGAEAWRGSVARKRGAEAWRGSVARKRGAEAWRGRQNFAARATSKLLEINKLFKILNRPPLFKGGLLLI